MRFNTFEVFCDLVETQSFTKAAVKNGITQSAVSQQVDTLEQLFKSRLVARGRKPFQLTKEGQALYDHSKQILQIYDALRNKLKQIEDMASNTIRVAAMHSIGLYDLPPYVKRFRNDHPAVNLQIEYGRASEVDENVLNNVVDLGLVEYPNRHRELEIMPFRNERLLLICHPLHPFAGQKAIKLRALNRQKFISFGREVRLRRALDKIFKDARVSVQHVMELDDVETMKRAVEIDAGIAILPHATVQQELADHTLAAVGFRGHDYFRPLAVIYKKAKALSPVMQQFIALLKEPV